ncbi:MAG: ABC transporter permease [Peptococcaceae bacterium 1109]|nr:MAG: ABC transporter permease [Peptococcaceae bacterium 1109]
MRHLFANTGTLARFIWRRDRVRLPVWVLSIAAFSICFASMFPSLYPPGPEREIIAQTFANPVFISMLGPGYGLADYHMGAIMAHQMLLFTAVVVAIMNILLTIRHSRRDEEGGRIEVIRSLPVGRLANAAALMLVLAAGNIVLGIATGAGLALLGLEGMDWAGSVTYGAVLAVTGMCFAALTLVFAQLTETSRATMGYAFAFLGLSFLLRAVGDVSSEPLSLISPLGLVLRAQVYVSNYWWPILITFVAAAALILLAFRLNLVRDLGAGFIPARPGRMHASPFLKCTLGLVFRLERTVIIGWAVGMFVLGASYGSVFGEVETFVQIGDLYQLMLPSVEGFSFTDQFVAMLLAVMSMAAAIPALLIILKLRGEEGAGRTEHLLSRAVSRAQIMGSFLAAALGSAVIMQVLSVLGLWSAAAAVVSDPFSLGEALLASLTYIPVIWALVGLAAALIGFAPQRTNLVWLYLGYAFFTAYFRALLQLPEWLVKLTPWGHIPNIPLETVSPATVVLILLAAIALMGLGFVGYAKRDISG